MRSSIRIKPIRKLRGAVNVPGDKSISHRAVMIGALAEGVTEVKGFLRAEDTLRTVKAFQSLGIQIEDGEDGLTIYGKGLHGLKPPKEMIDVGNSGTTIRLLLGILAGQPFSSTISGDESLRRRPMRRVVVPLREMGAVVSGRKDGDLAPLTIRGGDLSPIHYHSPIPSAQVKSSILLAGLYARGETSVAEPLKSRDHTERMLKSFGAKVKIDGLMVSIRGEPRLVSRKVLVPGDISSASFLIVAAAPLPGSKITIKGVGINPTRIGVIDLLRRMGVEISLKNRRGDLIEPVADIEVRGGDLKPIDIGGEIIPRVIDEIPLLSVAAALANGKSAFRDLSELRVKETDRLRAIAVNLRELGVRVEELEDGMVIYGGKLKGAQVKSFGDHRMAMAMVVAGLMAEEEVTVVDTDCIGSSFPGFMKTLEEVMG